MRKGVGMLLVTVVLIALVSVGCSKEAQPAANSTEKDETVQQGKAAQEKVVDEKAYSFTWALSNENSNPARELKPDNPYTKELERLTGVKVDYQFYETADRPKVVSTRIASGDLPDLLQLAETGINDPLLTSAIDGGAFLELNDLLEKYGQNILKAVPKETWESPMLSKNGKIFGIPKLAVQGATKTVFIRQDWLDKLGMKAPETFDDYIAFFEAVKKTDLNGNGEHDEIPIAFTDDLSIYNWLFEGYYGVFPGHWKWVDGQAQPDQIDPKIKDLLTTYKMMYEKGYINQDLFTAKLKDRITRIHNGNVGAFVHDVQQLKADTPYGDDSRYKVDGVKWTVLAGPTTPDGKKRFQPLGPGILRVNVINAKTKNPEEIIKYFDWMMSGKQEVNYFFSYGIEGMDYEVKDGKVAMLDSREVLNYELYRYVLSIGDWRTSKETLAIDANGEALSKGFAELMDAADDRGMFKYMPLPDTITKNPQLGVGDGSLYTDLYAKVILGREPVDVAFDNYVKAWKAQGGNTAIEEATAWYKKYTNQ